jgi:LacI family gluconate utilization system Gnt-I transcriptional repressor
VIFPSLSNAVFPDVLEGIHDVLMPAGYKIILANSHYSTPQEDQLVETMLEQNPDAIILTGVDQSDKTQQRLKNINIPVVQLMDLCDEPIDINIGISHFDAGYQMTQTLFNKGYKNIGFIGASMDKRSQRRLKGYQKALKDNDKDINQHVLTSLSHTSFQCGAELMVELTTNFDTIDALFFSNDDLAAGAIFECQRRGIQIPEQLAIVGFNDLAFSNAINPSLTTISIPRYEMGKQAAESLLKRLNKKDFKKRIEIGFSIIERQSCR